MDLGAISTLSAELDTAFADWRAGKPFTVPFASAFEDEDGLRAQVAALPVARAVSTAFELELTVERGAEHWYVRTSLMPPEPLFLTFEARTSDGLGLTRPIAEWNGRLAPFAELARALGGELAGPGCRSVPVATADQATARMGLPREQVAADLAKSQLVGATCDVLAGEALSITGLRLDDFAWLLFDASGKLLGAVRGDIALIGGGQLGVTVSKGVRPPP